MRSTTPTSRRNHAARRTLAFLAFATAAASIAAPAFADDAPSADQIIGQMKAALEPPKASLRRYTMTVNQGSEHTKFTLVQARKALPDGNRSLTVILAPEDAKGIAYLVAEKPKGQDNLEWLYIPVVRRVRELVPAENYTSFLDSDFTYGDLGFLDPASTNKLLGSETVGGKKTWKVESIPGSTTKQWYYSRIVTWVDAETLLPVKREFYSPANAVFKIEAFDDVSRVDGIATPFKITMANLPAKSTSVLEVTDVAYGLDIPDDLFGPDKLRTIAGLAFWQPKGAGAAAPSN